MPLRKGRSKATIRHNYLIERAVGKPSRQAWAIALSKAGRTKRG